MTYNRVDNLAEFSKIKLWLCAEHQLTERKKHAYLYPSQGGHISGLCTLG